MEDFLYPPLFCFWKFPLNMFLMSSLIDKVRFICFWFSVSMKLQDTTAIYPRAVDTLHKWAPIDQSTFMAATSLAMVISHRRAQNSLNIDEYPIQNTSYQAPII